ncbi:small ubiquitin-related modifier 2-like [Nycticebus coucang]|uniref:small ubiquitin-related modifier 2-like n=1 Tax=Nycticebus coucang TaxID=9470 RepID=UPI00234CC18A|nr:small ubiquitin-related modifier 2-like [Nycticebus coucang]
MADEKPKKEVKTNNNDHINLKVAGQDGSVVQFKIKRHTPLSKQMKAYCEKQVEMEGEDTIDVFQQQTGGVY